MRVYGGGDENKSVFDNEEWLRIGEVGDEADGECDGCAEQA
jgi:hypothetical protein